ncbi:MAG: BatD family protein [Prevotella sp.]|nr:BatD family protein [Prevotella sp.]
MKRYIYFLLMMLSAMGAHAQSITVSAPSQVSAGENFRVQYKVDTQDISDFRSNLQTCEGYEVIAGPSTSRSTSIQMINGHTTSSSTVTYTYVLYAAKNGTYTLPAAQATAGGKGIQSKPVTIAITGSAPQGGSQSPRMHEEDQGGQVRDAGSQISGKDLFIEVSANKKRVYEQEPILLTYKVYTLLELTQLEGKMPDLTGFHTQEVKLPQQKSFHIEQKNGRNYRCVTWSQYVMFPQMTGLLDIPSITFKGIVVQVNRNIDPFEAFFNGGSGYVEVKREIKAPGLKVQVDPLPERPAGFSGGVGRMNVEAELNHDQLKAGDPLTLTVTVSGTGNLKLLREPVVEFPKDFDKYDAKVTDHTQLTANGLEGSMVYEFLAVPRNAGKYTIPAIEFIYFDTAAKSYKTLSTEAFDIIVAKGNGQQTTVSSFTQAADTDIHGMKYGRTRQHGVGSFFFGSTGYLLSMLVPFVAFVALLIIFRKRALDNADIVKMRGKHANKVATKRLKKAHQLMAQGKGSEFYDEVLRALWGYVGDKLNMSVEKLSRENIEDNLKAHEVDADTVATFLSALDECEFERYAPGDAAGNMSKTFESAMTAIMNIENAMKRRKQSRKQGNGSGEANSAAGRNFLLILPLLLFVLNVTQLSLAQTDSLTVTKPVADASYDNGNYQEAIAQYEALLKEGVSSDLYYNLGNAYYRTNNITQAILAYERALQLAPGDRDIRFNLDFARSRTIDKITPQSEMFFVTWYRSLVNLMSVDAWAWLALVSIVLALALLLVYLFVPSLLLRKVGFYGACLFFVLFVFGNFFAWQQKLQFENHKGAIVTAEQAAIKQAPSAQGTDVVTVHEGTRVEITDRAMQGWLGVELADGRAGWIETKNVEEI